MKKAILLSFFLPVCIIGFSQTKSDEDYYGSPAKPKLISKDRVSASVMAGTGISFLSGSKNTSVTTYIAPKLNYQLTNRFKLNMGFMHYTASPNSMFFMNRNEGIINPSQRAVSGNMVFIGGEYQINKRMIFSGAVMTNVNMMNNQQNTNFKAASLGLDYKVSEHSSIGIRATISSGQSNYFNSNNPSNSMFPNMGMGTGFNNGFNNSFFR